MLLFVICGIAVIFFLDAQMAEENPPTEADYQTALSNVRNNDPSYKVLNLNNLVGAKPEWAIELFKALEHNSCKFSLFFLSHFFNF